MQTMRGINPADESVLMKIIDWREQIKKLVDGYLWSSHCTVALDLLVADELKVFLYLA